MTKSKKKTWQQELHALLDAFPEDAIALHTALVFGAFNGESCDLSPGDGDSVATCACAIGTIGASAGLNYGMITERLITLGVSEAQPIYSDWDDTPRYPTMEILPALEEYVSRIRPKVVWDSETWKESFVGQYGDRRRLAVIKEIEQWMKAYDRAHA